MNDTKVTLFLRISPDKRKDGSFRTILNLKHLNQYVSYKCFNMKGLNDFFKLLRKGSGWPVLI